MFTRFWWKDTAERSFATAAQSVLLVVGADQLNALSADWQLYLGFGLGGAALAFLKAVAAYNKDSDISPASLV